MEIRAYPNLRRTEDLKALRMGVSGMHSMRQIGRGREFEKLREYMPGDPPDEIHWKATARRGRPITKVFQVERTQEVYVIIDASLLSGRAAGDETVLERSIAASLIVGAAAEKLRGICLGSRHFRIRWMRLFGLGMGRRIMRLAGMRFTSCILREFRLGL